MNFDQALVAFQLGTVDGPGKSSRAYFALQALAQIHYSMALLDRSAHPGGQRQNLGKL
jgi:hypothetical protein